MYNYTIVLCRSAEVAETIAKGFGRPEGWVSSGHGAVTKNLTDYIPPMYYDKGYFHAYTKTECMNNSPSYQLLFA